MRIRNAHLIACCVALASVSAPVVAQTFKQYPGSRLDEKASQGCGPSAECRVYTTDDSFEKVYSFYKSLYREFSFDGKNSHTGPTLPSGKAVHWAFFIIDEGKDLAQSKYWFKVQRPLILEADQKDVRDVSAIQTIRKR